MAKVIRNKKTNDPAEIARQKLPQGSEVNVRALQLPSNASVSIEAATRNRVARVSRYDGFALLQSRGALTDAEVACVRRLEDDIAIRLKTEGERPMPTEVIDGEGDALGFIRRRLEARARLEDIGAMTGRQSFLLLLALCEPQVLNGQPLNNWRAVVQRVTGERFPHGQVALVRVACQNLAAAYLEYDNRPRKAA